MLFVGAERNGSEYVYFPYLFNADGKLIEKNAIVDDQASAYYSCSTMLNGEAIILGGTFDFKRQVHLKLICISLNYHQS